MYRVLIADDEFIIRNGIAKLLKKDSELEVVGLAEDGELALEMALEQKPDIAFVDINMPFLNGLEFIENLLRIHSDIIIIVITGYDDFLYVQQALRLGVFDYLLKPVSEKALFETIERGKLKFNSVKSKAGLLKWANIQADKNKNELITLFWNNLFEGRLNSEEIICQIKYLQLTIPQQFGISVVRFGILSKQLYDATGKISDYNAEEAVRVINDEKVRCNILYSHITESKDVIIIGQADRLEAWEDNISFIVKKIEAMFKVKVFVSSFVEDNFGEIQLNYNKALTKLNEECLCTKLVTDAKKYIEENYSDTSLSLQNVASVLHVSAQYLSRQFHINTGSTLVDYLAGIRLEKAKYLLEKTDFKMYEIANAVGYSTQHYFSAAFKKNIGCSPADYRKKKLNINV